MANQRDTEVMTAPSDTSQPTIVCSLCSKTFSSSRLLMKHMITKHPISATSQEDAVDELIDKLWSQGPFVDVVFKAEVHAAITALMVADRVDELQKMQTKWLKMGDPEYGIMIDERIATLRATEGDKS